MSQIHDVRCLDSAVFRARRFGRMVLLGLGLSFVWASSFAQTQTHGWRYQWVMNAQPLQLHELTVSIWS